MTRLARLLFVLTGLVCLGSTPAAAKKPVDPPADSATEEPTDEASVPTAAPDPDPAAGVPAVSAGSEITPRRRAGVFGIGLRGRVVSVPGWMLGLFTKNNVPLLKLGHAGIEGFFRRNNFEIAVAFSYQNMSSADGNWLGSGNQAAIDTDYVRFKSFYLLSLDVSFIWHQMFTSWLGMHYGAGIGAAYVHGKIVHNDSAGCTESNVGDLSQCHPVGVTCANGTCTPESALGPDNAYSVPPVIPIVNVLLGLDFHVPSFRGWEAKIEGGFYDAFFFGGGVAYTF